MTTEPEWYTVTEAARRIGVNRSTLSVWIREGKLKVSRLGHRTVRIHPDDLKRFMDEQAVNPLPNGTPRPRESSGGPDARDR